MKILLIAVTTLSAILLLLLTSATAKTALLTQQYTLLIGLNGAAALGLFVMVLVQLWRLTREYRARQFGSRLKLRLVLMFALMAVLPGMLVYAVSLQFAVKSIESWFNIRVDNALEGGLNLGRTALDYLLEDLSGKARNMALELSDTASVSTKLNQLREQAGIKSATLFGADSRVIASSSAELSAFLPSLPTSAQLRQGRHPFGYRAILPETPGGLTLLVLVPVRSSLLAGEDRVLQVSQPVPSQLAASAESVQEGYRDYQELSLGRVGLRRIYTMTLTLALLLAMFAAIGLAFILARRLSAPLSILAEGTEAVAQGDYSPRQALSTRDELGILTQSFNQMTRQLDDARVQMEKSRGETEAAKAYLESVLANLSAGVFVFDEAGRLTVANHGARIILRDELSDLNGLSPRDWMRHQQLAEAIESGFAGNESDWQRQVEIENAVGVTQTLLVRGSCLPEPSGGGFVLVFDDISQIIVAQRSAAWGEVARRLAHEIKNPLTPIQLSAERLKRKLEDHLEARDRELLDRATRTIVTQVEAMKNMVNNFRDYARMPPPELVPLDINVLVQDVLALYESSRVRIRVQLAPGLSPISGDATQLRQVIHNLLQNAEDALSDEDQPEIELFTEPSVRSATIVLRDNGAGFPPQILARAFEPYVTTKTKGTGLGLAIVKKIIDEHHGEIHLTNRSPHGAEVSIRLPMAT